MFIIILYFQSSTSIDVVNNNVEVMDKLIVAGYDVKVFNSTVH